MNTAHIPTGARHWARFQSKLAPRERRALGLAGAVVVAALLWWVALAPALATLRQAPAQHAKLDAELHSLQTMATLAKSLQAQPKLGRDEALRALEAATLRLLGPEAQLNALGDQATATFKMADADALAQWLAEVRINARTVPTELRLSAAAPKAPAAKSTAAAPPPTGVWQGSAVFALSR
jgi:general secretion pathway protein M